MELSKVLREDNTFTSNVTLTIGVYLYWQKCDPYPLVPHHPALLQQTDYLIFSAHENSSSAWTKRSSGISVDFKLANNA